MSSRNFFIKSVRNLENPVVGNIEFAQNLLLKVLSISSLLCLFSLGSAFGQNAQHTENKADQTLRGAGRVNPSTLAMEVNIPLSSYPGRGINIPIGLSYSSKVWRMEFQGLAAIPNSPNCKSRYQAKFGENSASGWTSSMGQAYVEYTGSDNIFNGDNGFPLSDPCDPAAPGNTYNGYVRRIQVHLPGGESHEMRLADDPKIYVSFSNCSDPYSTSCDQNDMSLPQNWTGWYYSVDGSNLKYFENRFDNVYYLQLPDGSYYSFSGNLDYTSEGEGYKTIRKAVRYTDRHNNQITYHPSDANHPNGYWTDTMGRILDVPLPRTAPASPGIQPYTLPGLGAGNITYKFHWKKLKDTTAQESALTDFNQTLKYPGDWTGSPSPWTTQRPAAECLFHSDYEDWVTYALNQPPFNPILLTAIELPNGQKYRFSYNVYGEIDRIFNPAGGEGRFNYETIPALTQSSQRNKPVEEANRGVKIRQVYEASGGTPIQSTFDATYVAPNGYKVSVTNPDGTTSERFLFQGNPSCTGCTQGTWGYDNGLAGMAYEERAFSAPDAQGVQKLVNRKLTHWTKTSFGLSYGGSADWHPRVDNEESFVYDADGNALSANTKYEYEGNLSLRETPVLVRKTTQYAFRAMASGSSFASSSIEPGDPPDPDPTPVPTPAPSSLIPVRIAEMTYLINDQNVPPADRDAYKNQNLIGLVTVSKVRDGAGAIVSQSEAKYDETGYSPGKRGNATSSRVWDSTRGNYDNSTTAYLVTRAKYDAYGNVVEKTDAKGKTTLLEYDATYHAFLTKVTTPIPDPNPSQNSDGQAHGSQAAFETVTNFDTRSGLLLSTVDSNGQTTVMSYADPTTNAVDPLLRLRKVTAPNGQQTITEYGAGTSPTTRYVKVKTQIEANVWKEGYTWFDGLGRTVKTQTVDAAGDVFVETKYDDKGRVWLTSNPYRANETIFWTETTYDTAGRIWKVTTKDDNAVVETAYSLAITGNQIGTVVTVTDQAGKQRRSLTNSLGQLVRVDEPDSSNNSLGTVDAPVQPTNYSYDALGNLTTVVQGSTGAQQTRTFMYDSLSRLKSATNPESGTVSYTYDVNGNLKTKQDARSVITTYEYDALNRVKSRTYSDSATPPADYYYDGTGLAQVPANSKGKLTKVANPVSATEYTEFDSLGRIKASRQTTSGATAPYAFSYTYDLAGNLKTETYPSGRVVTQNYNGTGDLSSVTGNSAGAAKTYASGFVYTAAGAVKELQLGNSRWETTVFNSRLQPVQIGLGTSAADTSIWRVNYDYGELNSANNTFNQTKNNGNVARQTITVAQSNVSFVQDYTYDSLNRLKSAQEKNGATQTWKQTFLYDRFGNRTFDTSNNNTTTISGCAANICNPAINTTDNRFSDNQGYVYDAAGNLKNDNGKQFFYNGENKQIQFTDASGFQNTYSYDGDGRRVRKNSSTENVLFVYDAFGRLAAEYQIGGQTSQTAQTKYTTTDSLGSPRIITKQDGTVDSRRDFLPFGEEIAASVGARSNVQGYAASADTTRQKFATYERDAEANLDFAQARMYNSGTDALLLLTR